MGTQCSGVRMNVTDKLVRVFRVDTQIRGLESRLRGAERFLNEQNRQIEQISSKRSAIEAQLRQLTASANDNEGETKRIDERIADLRERMNTAQTNKEYKALLTEVNTYKEKRGEIEETALGQIEKIDQLKAQLAELDAAEAERQKVRGVAETERQQRADEIKDRLAELQGERAKLVADVPDGVLKSYQELIEVREDEAMAPIEIQDRKRHEFSCGSCMMTLPVESMSALLSHGNVTYCVSCGCILYVEEKVREAMTPTSSKR